MCVCVHALVSSFSNSTFQCQNLVNLVNLVILGRRNNQAWEMQVSTVAIKI